MSTRMLLALLVLGCVPTPPPGGVCVDLTPRTVEVRLRERDGSSSNKLVTLGTVDKAENLVMSSPGVYDRRTGTDAVETVSGAKELTAYSGALVTLSDTQLKQRIAGAFTAPAASALRWQTVTGMRSLETGVDQISHAHVRAADGRDWHVWEAFESGALQVKYSVVDPTTGAHIVQNATVDAGASRPYIVAVGTDILIFYVEGAETANTAATAGLRVRKIAQATPTALGSEVSIEASTLIAPATDLEFGSFPYDVIVHGSTPVIAYRVLDATHKTRVKTWNVASMTATTTVTSAGVATTGHDVIGFLEHDFADSNYYLALGYVDSGTGVRTLLLQVVPTTLGAVTSHTLKTEAGSVGTGPGWQAATGYVDPNLTAHVVAGVMNHAGENDTSGAHRWYYYATRTSGGVVASTIRPGLSPASKPWAVGADRYIVLAHTSYAQPTYFLADPSTGTIYGRAMSGAAGVLDAEHAPFAATPTAGVYPNRHGRLPAPQVSGSAATVALLRLRQAPPYPIAGGFYRGGVERGAVTLTFTPWTAGGEHQPAVAADSLLIPGGAPREFDGATLSESGWHLFPELPPLDDAGNELPTIGSGSTENAYTYVSGSMVDGQYYVQFVWEWTDSRSRVKQSAPSFPLLIVHSGTTGVTIKILNPLSAKTGVRLVAYRTLVGAGRTAPYYRAATAAASDLLTTTSSLYTSITLTEGDAAVAVNPQLYTDDGTLDNAPAFTMRQAKVWKDRTVFLLEENRRAFGWSKLTKPDTGLEWSDDFYFEIGDEYGDLTAHAPFGSNYLLFKRDAVYWLSGAGPDDTGEGQFSEPIRLEGIPGTERPRSVLVTEEGVWYQAPDNVVWLIAPGLQATPVGEACADQTAAIVGAIHVRDKRQVRLHTASTTLVYDTLHSRVLGRPVWTTFTGQASLACAMLGAEAHYLTTAAGVRKDGTGYQEAGTSYQAVLRLTWASLAGLGGYVRTWAAQMIGEARGAHTLTAVITSDFGDGSATRSVASSALKAAHGYRVLAKVPRVLQQKTAVRLQLQDDSPNTAGFRLEALNLHCGFGPGRPPLPDSHRMT